MPTVSVKKRLVEKYLGCVYSLDDFDELCFQYGLELDEVVMEKVSDDDLEEEEVYKIEVPANRYDVLCVEGLSRALSIFLGKIGPPIYKLQLVENRERILVRQEVAELRPFVVGAILRDIKFDKDSYASFIDLQDKLHQNICRRRTLVAIGTHDYDTIQGPFIYGAEKPNEISFVALNQTKEYSAEELMTIYSADSHLKHYLPIIAGKERYPVIRDRNGVILSMPPIINGEHSKIHLGTKNVFIEATATDLERAKIVLDCVVTMFSCYCEDRFTIEAVDVEYMDKVMTFPELKYRSMDVDIRSMNKRIGLQLSREEIMKLLSKMSLDSTKLNDKNELKIGIPPTRHDVLHECDIAEDVAIAFGFNRIPQMLPEVQTIAEPFALNKLSDLIRGEIISAGWTESLNFALCSADDVSSKLRRKHGLAEAVKISNPKTVEFQVARTTLLSGLLKTIASNKNMPLPLRLFELQDVVLVDETSEVRARNERRLAAVYYNKVPGFEIIHGLMDRIMQILGIKATKDGTGYHIIADDNEPTYLEGRCAQILGPDGVKLGHFGVVHPEVVLAFDLNQPLSAFEINIEPFL